MQSQKHIPVLLDEAIAGLNIKPNGIYIDATFGAGGHSRRILDNLDAEGILICVDKDCEAVEIAKQFCDRRMIIKQGSFSKIGDLINKLQYCGEVDGILLDLGVSSMQLDDVSRGFSFSSDGPLDMRMDQTQRLDAATWINKAKESTICDVLKTYGEERYSKKIAAAIVRERKIQKIITTGRLAEIVKLANPKWERHKHPATRTFQAIRIFINNELEELHRVLEMCLKILTVGGRLVVISFHSLEDRIVKQFIRKYANGDFLASGILQRIGSFIRADSKEVANNVRARSAILRIAEKLR